MFAVLLTAAALAAPVPIDSMPEILADVQARHQARFLVGATWDTQKPLEKLANAVRAQADVRRVADDLSTASAWLNEQVSSGAYQCALYVGKSSGVMYSLHRFGDCDHPPTASQGPVAAKGTLSPDPAQTGAMFVSSVGGAPELLAIGSVDPSTTRAKLQAELGNRKWPTGEVVRYAAAATIRELHCVGDKPLCNVAVAWAVTDSERKALVYQVVTRGEGSASSAPEATSVALQHALLSLLSRPLLVSRLDAAAASTGDPAPNWAGEVSVRTCPVAGPPLPSAEGDLRARVGTAARGQAQGPAVLLSPDGWALVPTGVATGPVQLTVGRRTAEATVVRIDLSLGLALVRAPGSDWPCLMVGATAPSAGAKLYAPMPDQLAAASVIGVQTAGSLKFLNTNLAAPPTGTPLFDGTGQLRAVASSAVSLGGLARTPIGLPVSVLLDRLDIVLATASDADAAARMGTRGATAVLPTIDTDDAPR